MSAPRRPIDPEILERVLKASDARLLAIALSVAASTAPIIDRRTT